MPRTTPADRQSPSEIIRVKAAVRKRDGHRCVRCGLTNEQSLARTGRQLDVHRTTPGSPYSVRTGVCETLCRTCHGPEPRRPRGTGPAAEYLTTRLPTELVLKMKLVARHRGVKFRDYFHELLGRVLPDPEWYI
jgi:5-methylcytosine-specific restriction endonuclease McrA